MYTVKTLAISLTATVLLFSAPQSHAQEQEDLELMQVFLSIVTDYFRVIEATYEIATDSEKAAILQMMKIQEAYEERGEKARSTVVLQEVLAESRNQTIRNAAYMLLGDTLKETGRTDEAIKVLRQGLDENIEATQ